MKKLLASVLCLCLLAALLSGCGSKIEEYSSETISAAEEAAATIDQLKSPANAYAADDLVCTINGLEFQWEEYYYWLNNCRQSVESQLGEITDWDAQNAYYVNMTNEQVVRSLAQSDMLHYGTILSLAEEAGIAPTDEQAEDQITMEADQLFGDGDGTLSEEEQAAFEQYLAEAGVSYAFQLKLAKYMLAERALFEYQTADITDEQVIEWANEQGYMAAKHILLLTVDSQTREPLDEATIAEKAATAEYLAAELTEAKNAELAAIEAAGDAETETDASGEPIDPAAAAREDFEEYFDKLMNENSEDTGLATHPEGYLFLPGEMVEEFENGVLALDEDLGLSGVVESDYGYHIILRMPLDPAGVLGQNSYGYDVTLRTFALNNIFNQSTSNAAAEAELEWAEGFDVIDLAQLFATL